MEYTVRRRWSVDESVYRQLLSTLCTTLLCCRLIRSEGDFITVSSDKSRDTSKCRQKRDRQNRSSPNMKMKQLSITSCGDELRILVKFVCV
ncbi:hypothetical protein MPTK1_5g10120 [Marchantia polymorpha subsp. ruderalis]|uniref:Uncharacterized protein n=2 Tax=Marchantia polymorpha TaxID=3197 RepID=A0AAF6BGT9_MARPO|nr:hypothetical protein MARPO_0048s0060 [Marchantia polymorpha]BBN11223.1 hypothetical protein Mp_5g10120 [Marchantia polymorpha subsp. ruderalis]|eukprot:PTQ38947.1 hypothetical protein MARPO_0048s0060 [Marchantia polymorpha]